jgi:hypothetical protein
MRDRSSRIQIIFERSLAVFSGFSGDTKSGLVYVFAGSFLLGGFLGFRFWSLFCGHDVQF